MSEQSDAIFSRIANRYDLINRILSLGREQAWRESAARLLPEGRVLDLGSGTGAAAPVFRSTDVVALDPVAPMLALSPIAARVVGIGEQLPFSSSSFDGVFSAYVFRNLTSVDETLAEIHRVLRPGGAAAIVDLSRPVNPLARVLHRIGSADRPSAGRPAGQGAGGVLVPASQPRQAPTARGAARRRAARLGEDLADGTAGIRLRRHPPQTTQLTGDNSLAICVSDLRLAPCPTHRL